MLGCVLALKGEPRNCASSRGYVAPLELGVKKYELPIQTKH